MVLSRNIPCNTFQIWNPRWHDRTVLLADYKLGHHNLITFPKSNVLQGEWYISGAVARKHPTMPFKTKSGATMLMREVSLDALEPLERA